MIEIKDLYFSYGENFELNISNLVINPSEIVSIIGPNGAGKSTLIKIFSGLIKNYKGSVTLDKKEIKKYSHKKLAQKISIVPQEFNTIYDYDVESILSTARLPFSNFFSFTETLEDKRIINNVLQQTDLNNYKYKKFSKLSGGEKQRVLIARAFAQLTNTLLLDEFSSHLDPGHTQELLNLVKNISLEKDKTVISIFHDINMASLYSNRIIIINNGKITHDGSPRDVITKSIIKNTYNLDAEVIYHPLKNCPQIIFN